MNTDSTKWVSYMEPKNESISPALNSINASSTQLLEELI
jgi:hypothetical protein